MPMTNTFIEHLQRAIFGTFDHWGIWSEWWENMTWPTKRQQERQRQRQWQIHLENTSKERSLRLLTFETFDHRKQWERQTQRQWRWQIHLENTPNEGFLETFWEHHWMAIQEKFWVWPIIHCYEFSQTLPDQTGGGWPRVDDYWTLRSCDVEARWHIMSPIMSI